MSNGQMPYGNQQPYPGQPFQGQPGQPQPVGQPPYGAPQNPTQQPSAAPAQGWNGAPQQGQPQQLGRPQPVPMPAQQPLQQAQQPGAWQQQPMPPRPQPTAGPVHPQTAVPAPEPKKVSFVEFDLPLSTTEFLPDLDATQVCGLVFGVALRPRDLRPAPDNVATLVTARQEALTQMVAMAKEAGAEAVVGVHFDTAKVSDTLVEVCAYGTAVLTESGAQLTDDQLDALAGEPPTASAGAADDEREPGTPPEGEQGLGEPPATRPETAPDDVQTLASLTDDAAGGEPLRKLDEGGSAEHKPEDLPEPRPFG